MKKILALMLTVIMVVGIFALPVMAEESATVLNENFGKVKIMGKVQSNGSVAFAVRSSFGESETQDVIQYFVSPRGQETAYGMENNQAFDFYPYQELVSKIASTVFSSGTKGGGDERTPVNLSGFGWIGAGHGMTCAVNVIGEHSLTYANIGDIYTDKDGVEWVLLRVTQVKSGSDMVDALVFISKNLKSGKTDTNPTFYSLTDAHKGTELVNTADETNRVTISSYKNSAWLRPAYNMTTQNVYIVNDGVKTLVDELEKTYEGDYVLVEEKYTIMNPAYVAQAIIDGRPEGGYTENPSLAVGKGLVTFDLQQIYNPDGTVVHNWETTYHQDVTLGEWGGIQYGKKGDYIYLPFTKAFTSKSNVSGVVVDSMAFDFSNLFDTTTGYPEGYLTINQWADTSYVPNRRLDFNKTNGVFDKAFAGGQLPVFDNVPSERVKNTDRAFYFWNTRKAYHFSAGGSSETSGINKRYPDLTGKTLKGSAYKKWIEDFDAEGTASYYSVPYFSDGDNSRYMYFDLYKPDVTKKYDISAYLGTYSISELEKTENLDYEINYETGILTVSSKENNQTSADSLVLKAKYVGESVPAVEMKMRALPELYDVSLNEKLEEIADLMESVGAPEDDYDPALIAKYNNLLAQKEAYEQAIKDEAANADRVAGLDNRYEYVELYLFQDIFATYAERSSADWYEWTSGEGEITKIWPFKGISNGITPKYPSSRTQASNDWAMAINFDGKSASAYKNGVSIETNPMISYDEKLERYIVNTEKTKYKLGEIAEGKKGGNFATFAVTYDVQTDAIADGLGIKEQTLNTSVYPNVGTSKRMDKGIYPINKSGISEINLLLTTTQVSAAGKDRAMRLPVTIEYVEDGYKENIAVLVGTIGADFQDTVFAAPKTSTTYADVNTNKVVAKTVLGKNVTNENATIPIVGGKLYLPEESFILATHLRSYESGAFDGYVNSFSIPVDPNKTVKTITLENTAANIAESFTSGCVESAAGTTSNIVFVPIEVEGASEDYNYYLHATRACGSTGIFAMTLTNAVTWQDKIDALNAKMLALNAESSTYADVEALREEIAELLAQNSSIVYVKDFSEEARANIDNVEAALKEAAIEAERVENLSKNVFTHVDMNKFGNKDLYATTEEFTSATGQFGYSNTLKGAIVGATVVEKTEGDVTYKEYYTKDDHLLAVYDVASATYYYNASNSSYKEDAYTYLGKTYRFKYVPADGEKPYYAIKTDGTETANKSVNGVYVWYHDGVGPYYEKSAVAANKAIIYSAAVSNGDSLLALLTDVKTYTAKDLITGNDVSGTTGKIKTAGGTEFSFGPIAPSNSATVNGFILDDKNATITFGEDGVKADYINLLASIYATNNVNVSFDKVTVNYENEDGTVGKKDFGIVLGKTGSKSAGIYSRTVQEVVEGSIFKVEKTKAQSTFSNRLSNKESVPGISLDDVNFGTKVADSIIYPTEMLNVGTMFTQHTFYPNPGEANAGVYKIPVSEFHKVKSIVVHGNFGCGETFTKNTSDFYVEGTQQSGNSVAVPVTVDGGDENYNYYAIYSPTWTNRALLYAVNAEKLPVIDKITAIEAKMEVAKTTADVEEIEALIENLTSDGSVVYPKDFNAGKVETYEALKETIDVSATVDVTKTETKVTVKATINNAVRMAGKKFTVITVFTDKDENVVKVKIDAFETTTDKEIIKNVVITDIPASATEVKAFVWKDFTSLKPLANK